MAPGREVGGMGLPLVYAGHLNGVEDIKKAAAQGQQPYKWQSRPEAVYPSFLAGSTSAREVLPFHISSPCGALMEQIYRNRWSNHL